MVYYTVFPFPRNECKKILCVDKAFLHERPQKTKEKLDKLCGESLPLEQFKPAFKIW